MKCLETLLAEVSTREESINKTDDKENVDEKQFNDHTFSEKLNSDRSTLSEFYSWKDDTTK